MELVELVGLGGGEASQRAAVEMKWACGCGEEWTRDDIASAKTGPQTPTAMLDTGAGSATLSNLGETSDGRRGDGQRSCAGVVVAAG